MKLLYITTVILFTYSLSAQFKLTTFYEETFTYYHIPLQLLAQNDSSVVILSEIKTETGNDLIITKYAIEGRRKVFEQKLGFDKLFDNHFSSKKINFTFFSNEHSISFAVKKISPDKAIIYAGSMDLNGNSFQLIKADSIEATDKNLNTFTFNFTQSSNKKNIIIVCHKMYLSGFSRDKCTLLNSITLEKTLEIDLAANAINTCENYNFDTDFQNNLFFGILDRKEGMNDSLTIFKVETLTKIFSKFKVPKQQRNLHFIPLFSNQILIYGTANYRFKEKLFSQKAIYYTKINLNTNQLISDTLVFLPLKNQLNLTYAYKTLAEDPSSKKFTLLRDDIIDGHLISVFEHTHHSMALNDASGNILFTDPYQRTSTVTENLEYLIADYDLTANKCIWTTIIPKKIVYSSQSFDKEAINPFSSIYFQGNIHLSFYEKKRNAFLKANDFYRLPILKEVKSLRKNNTVMYSNTQKTFISSNETVYWKPLNSLETVKGTKIYYFNYTKTSINIAYYSLLND